MTSRTPFAMPLLVAVAVCLVSRHGTEAFAIETKAGSCIVHAPQRHSAVAPTATGTAQPPSHAVTATQLMYKSKEDDHDDGQGVNHDLPSFDDDAYSTSSVLCCEQDPVLKIPELEERLKTMREESPSSADQEAEAAIQKLQDELNQAKTLAEFGVRAIQLDFYQAFSDGNLQQMADIWSTDANDSDDVSPSRSRLSCIHPGMPSIEGRDSIMESWEQIFKHQAENAKFNGKFEIQAGKGAKISLCGTTAMCSCVEEITYRRLDAENSDKEAGSDIVAKTATTQRKQLMEALNVYKREDGKWRMTMHMANVIA